MPVVELPTTPARTATSFLVLLVLFGESLRLSLSDRLVGDLDMLEKTFYEIKIVLFL